MKVRTKLYKSKQESRAGKWIARIIYTDPATGREKEKQITRDKRNDAVDARVRSLAPVKSYLKILREFFGKQKIGEITTTNLRAYRQWRLEIGSRRPEVVASGVFKAVKLTTINRELQTMRKMMNHALAQRLDNP